MTIQDDLPAILDIARWAPSVHNTQPWKVNANTADSISIVLEKRYLLKDGDPTGRETAISLGIFAEAIGIAASGFGWHMETVELKDKGAILAFTAAAKQDTDNLVSLLHRRCTDRSIYKPAPVTTDMVQRLENAMSIPGISIKVISDKTLLGNVADLTSKGIGVALSSPGFRKELSRFLTLPWSANRRGIAVRSLYIPFVLELFEPLLMRLGMGLKAEVALEKRRWQSASAVIVLLADGDVPKYWLDVGRTYMHISLQVEALGLSQATSAAIVEASNYHEDIEEALGTTQRVLSLIRIGHGKARRHHSPRVGVRELLT